MVFLHKTFRCGLKDFVGGNHSGYVSTRDGTDNPHGRVLVFERSSALSTYLTLAQRRHRDRDVVGSCADSHATFTGVRRYSTNSPRRWTFCCPEHVTQHSARRSGAVRSHCLHISTSRVDQRTAEARAFRCGPCAGNDVHCTCEFCRRKRQDRRPKLRFTVYVLLPICLCGCCIIGLLARNHRVGVVQHWRRCVQPISRCFARQRDQPAIARGEVDR